LNSNLKCTSDKVLKFKNTTLSLFKIKLLVYLKVVVYLQVFGG
jgi:hypothetical protein